MAPAAGERIRNGPGGKDTERPRRKGYGMAPAAGERIRNGPGCSGKDTERPRLWGKAYEIFEVVFEPRSGLSYLLVTLFLLF